MVKDIRRALRRKYASRSNLDRIFEQWDRKSTGAVSAEDICAGLNKIGIRASLEEAMALKASAGQGEDLSPKQFSDLIFSTEESLKVDLTQIPAPSIDEKTKAFERLSLYRQPNRLDLASLNQTELDMFRQRNHWRDLLKK